MSCINNSCYDQDENGEYIRVRECDCVISKCPCCGKNCPQGLMDCFEGHCSNCAVDLWYVSNHWKSN